MALLTDLLSTGGSMATTRTVLSPMQVPLGQAYAHSEVLDDNSQAGGLYHVGVCANTLYEQKRGTLFYVAGTTALPVTQGVGDELFVRAKAHGGAGGEEPMTLWVYAFVDELAVLDITLTDVVTADTCNVTYDASGGAYTGWIESTTTCDGDDANEFVDVEIVDNSYDGIVEVYAYCYGYYREREDLQAVTVGDAAYPNGVIPIHAPSLAGEKPVSTARLHDMSQIPINLYENRGGGTIFTAATPLGVTTPDVYFPADIPSSMGDGEVTIRTYVYAEWDSATDDWHLRAVGTELVSDIISITGAKGWYGPFDLVLPATPEGADRPALQMLELERLSQDAPATFYSFCSYILDCSYG